MMDLKGLIAVTNKRIKKKRFNQARDKKIQSILMHRPKELTTPAEIDRWLGDELERQGLVNWETQQAIDEVVHGKKLKQFDSVDLVDSADDFWNAADWVGFRDSLTDDDRAWDEMKLVGKEKI